jgi:hypothetical protein
VTIPPRPTRDPTLQSLTSRNMEITLIATGDAARDPRIRASARRLRDVGHAVTVVSGGSGPFPDENIEVVRVASRYPQQLGRLGWALRRMQPGQLRSKLYEQNLVRAIRSTNPDIIYATSPATLSLAAAAARDTAVVARRPEWGSAGSRDIVALAPHNKKWSESPTGPGIGFHTDDDDRSPWFPQAGRYSGRKMVLAYRRTETTPGRYLEVALERAGFEVRHVNDRLDWADVDAATEFVVFVESPHPAIEVVGTNPGIPVLFWAHHGDHSTDTHVRLTRRYGAHAVLLAHSWHLAHHFPVAVHRFPFGVPSELLDPSRPWGDRTYDVGFVGAQIRREGGTYGRRQELVAEIEGAIPSDRQRMASAVDADALAEIYGNSRVVFNEGGLKHYPITMRVFEAIGAGALLVTDEIPGTDCLFEVDEHYKILEEPIVDQISGLMADPQSALVAEAATEFARGRHDYDHRIDELVDIVASIDPYASPMYADSRELSKIAQVIDADAQVRSVAAYGLDDLVEQLPWREVWVEGEREKGRGPKYFDAAAVGAAWDGDASKVVGAARRFIYLTSEHRDEILGILRGLDMEIVIEDHGPVTRIDLLAEGYRVFPDGHRLAR